MCFAHISLRIGVRRGGNNIFDKVERKGRQKKNRSYTANVVRFPLYGQSRQFIDAKTNKR